MLESIGDVVSLGVLILCSLAGIYLLFVVSDKHHDELMKLRQEMYYAFYDSLEDDDEESFDRPYENEQGDE